MNLEKYIGAKFNSLQVLDVWRDVNKNETMCLCLCDCGKEHITYLHKVRYGKIGSCGCKRGNIKHQLHKSRLYRIWQAMKTRCNNPNACNYKYYGGKGIKVDKRWCDFILFEEWANANGYKENLTIDRIDADKDYCPENCRWVTMKEQNNNHKSNIHRIKIRGGTYSLREFVDLIGESYGKMQTRLYRKKITTEEMEKKYNNKELYLNEYQQRAMGTCLPSCENFSYMMLNLVGEVGEFAGKVAKRIRKEELLMGGAENAENKLTSLALTRGEQYEILDDLKSEAGDILWQLAGLCKVMGWNLNDVAQTNLDKLANRKKEGTIITHQDH